MKRILIIGNAGSGKTTFAKQLAKKLKALKTHVILLTWDPANTGSTSRFLSEEVCTHIDIQRLAGKDSGLIGRLTVRA